VRESVHAAVEGLTEDQVNLRIEPGSNSIAWLVWHLARVQDDHVAAVAHVEQVWTSAGWLPRFDLPLDPSAIGYGHSDAEVAAVKVRSVALLSGYYDEVHEQTLRFVRTLSDHDLDRVVDESWDPPVTLGVRLVSVIDDDLEHAGQAAFIRGLLLRR